MNHGEYIIKLENITDHLSIRPEQDTCKIEILQWGKINTGSEQEENKIIRMASIAKIYEPEPDKFPIYYEKPKFTEIPEWLFSRKITSKIMSKLNFSDENIDITKIPKKIFKNCINIEKSDAVFKNTNITEIPEDLFKYNVKAKSFNGTFAFCKGLTSIPEGLFKNNVNAIGFDGTFVFCKGLTSIPEGLFKNNVNAKIFSETFSGCIGLASIPEGLFKNNVNTISFNITFSDCIGLTSIPEELFKYNTNANDFSWTFKRCISLTNIPEKIVEAAKELSIRGGNVSEMFEGCTSASNYSTIPSYMK